MTNLEPFTFGLLKEIQKSIVDQKISAREGKEKNQIILQISPNVDITLENTHGGGVWTVNDYQ